MKLRLILISCILSVIPLILFQTYFYYSTQRILIDGQKTSDVTELRNSKEDIEEKLAASQRTLNLLSQLTLPRVSLEFNRPEALDEFLSKSSDSQSLFLQIFVLDANKEFFAASKNQKDILSLIEVSNAVKDVANSIGSSPSNTKFFKDPTGSNVDVFVGSKILGEGEEVKGYIIAQLRPTVFKEILSRLRERLKLGTSEEAFLSISGENLRSDAKCNSINNNLGNILICYMKKDESSPLLIKNISIVLISLLAFVLIYTLVYKFFIGRILSPLYQFLQNLTKITEGNFIKQSEDSKYSEINTLISSTNSIVEKLKASQEQELEKVRIEAVAKVATQAAHDIRSPLEVLKSLKDEMDHFPDSTRKRVQLSINRIEEITFHLLKSNKDTGPVKIETKSEDLMATLLSVMTEKNIEYRNLKSLTLSDNLGPTTMGRFSKVDRASLKSILSNLINNAVESFEGAPGSVQVELQSHHGFNIINILDNGPGIPQEVADKLFTKGFTTKKNGNGLGLHNSKHDIEAVGGSLTFQSEVGAGSVFTITLPQSEVPATYIHEILAYKYERIIILDDDPAFHEVWARKLQGIECQIEHIFSVSEMFSKYQTLNEKNLLLSDFELMDKNYDGIDAILKLEHAPHSILVTARSDERGIQERCLKNGIRLLPKSLVNFVTILKMPPSEQPIVLIDDDRLSHLNWTSFCKKRGLPFKGFMSIADFLSSSGEMDRNVKIYIDSNLGDGIKGEIESEKIYRLGFQNLYLTTGYQKADIAKPLWIKEVYSKSPECVELIG